MDKRPLEKNIQRYICDYLQKRELFFWRSNNIPVYGRSNDGVRRFRALPKYTPRGIPDITIIHKGMPIFLEVKRDDKAKLRPEQKIMCKKIRSNGGLYFVVWSVEQVEKLLIEIDPLFDKN